MIAPSAHGPWLLRIDNEGDAPIVIVADVRLLSFEVQAWNKKTGRYARPEICDGPAAFGLEHDEPFDRQLVLKKGESYVEAFDPRLICFGNQADLLSPNAIVRPSFGFPEGARGKAVGSRPPFVVDGATAPRWYAPRKRLAAPTMVLSFAPPARFPRAEPSDPAAAIFASAEQVSRHRPRHHRRADRTKNDQPGAALMLSADRFADARSYREVSANVQVRNVGQRPIWVALRARQLSFKIYGRDANGSCPPSSPDHYVPRDMFEPLPPGKQVRLPVLLSEACAPELLDRPGLYVVVPTLHADTNGAEYGLVALTGTVGAGGPDKSPHSRSGGEGSILVRIRHGARPFYAEPPKAIPTQSVPAALPAVRTTEKSDAT